MKNNRITTLALVLLTSLINAQNNSENFKNKKMNDLQVLKIESHVSGLKIGITHQEPKVPLDDYAILFLHGSSFPSALSFGFKMNNYSMLDSMSDSGYEVYALDFLGYGNSDRYKEMETNLVNSKPVGKAVNVYKDVDKAVNFIIKKTGKTKVYLVGHSWGGSVAALYASQFPDKVAKLVLFAAITQREDASKPQKIEYSFETMTPDERINSMKNLTPSEKECQLAAEVFNVWGDNWLKSDPLVVKFKSDSIRFPAGPSQDVEDLLHGKSYYDPANIKLLF